MNVCDIIGHIHMYPFSCVCDCVHVYEDKYVKVLKYVEVHMCAHAFGG